MATVRAYHCTESGTLTAGIFQLQVTVQGRPVFRNGLPFQAKKNWKGRDRRLADQARDKKQRVGDGIVIDYTPNGYTACEIGHVIEARGNRKAVADGGHFQPLGQILAHRFLDCLVGIRGLYYDDHSETFVRGLDEAELSIFDTSVSVVERRGDAPRRVVLQVRGRRLVRPQCEVGGMGA